MQNDLITLTPSKRCCSRFAERFISATVPSLNQESVCISQDFSAVTDDIFVIFRMLKALKEIIINLTA